MPNEQPPNEMSCLDCRWDPEHDGPHQTNGAATINGERVRYVVIWHPHADRVRDLEVAWRQRIPRRNRIGGGNA